MTEHRSDASLKDLARETLRVGVLSFGGPAAQISLMQRVLVDERKWISGDDFLRALSFCMLLPGPEAMQLATYIGWRLHGVVGGLIAGLNFVWPGALVVGTLAAIYATFGDVPWVEALFLGIQATVISIVIQALLKLSKRALTSRVQWGLAALSFVAIFGFSVPFPIIVALAALFGYLTTSRSQTTTTKRADVPLRQTIQTAAIWLSIWLIPILVLWLANAQLLTDIALLFSKLAVVTFGGAYAVLAYMTQTIVADYNWLTTAEMIDGLGLAETTPGPLILVTEFVAFLTAYKSGGLALGALAALVALWVTFVPCFLWIFCGAPYVEWLTTMPRLSSALTAITAAVVGVILSLALWFAIHVLFGAVNVGVLGIPMPVPSTLDWRAFVITVLGAVLLLWRGYGIGITLGAGATMGIILSFI